MRYGDKVLDLAAALHDEVFAAPTLNPFMARGHTAWRDTRALIQNKLASDLTVTEPHLIPLDRVRLHMPFEVADYVDFYCSRAHARTSAGSAAGRRAAAAQLASLPSATTAGRAPSWPPAPRSAPARPARRGRFGRPRGWTSRPRSGFVVGVPPERARSRRASRSTSSAWCWSTTGAPATSRRWEYVPLGPFLGKSFATSISPGSRRWRRCPESPAGRRTRRRCDYLRARGAGARLTSRCDQRRGVSRPPYRGMYWTPDQQLAHLTVNGASLRTGDLFACGEVSGEQREEQGSLDRAHLERHRPDQAGQRRPGHSWRTATP